MNNEKCIISAVGMPDKEAKELEVELNENENSKRFWIVTHPIHMVSSGGGFE